MNRPVMKVAAASALLAVLALAGCKKEEAAPPPPPPAAPAPAPAPAPVVIAATASITDVVVGNAVDAEGKVSAAVAEFKPADTITASVSTATSDPAATVAGTLGAKWFFEGDQLVNEETKTFSFTGPGVTNFQISKPDGWPVGKYKLEVSLDGAVVQTREFTVK